MTARLDSRVFKGQANGTIIADELSSLSFREEKSFWASAPPVGGGKTNKFLIDAAHIYRRNGRSKEEARRILKERRGDSPERLREIERAVDKAYNWQPNGAIAAVKKWPAVDEAFRNEISSRYGGLEALRKSEFNSYDFSGEENNCDFVIERIRKPDDLICAGSDERRFQTRSLAEWGRGRLSQRGLIVPSPMSARTGLTQEGKVSEHTKDNTGPRAHIIVEFDTGTLDQQASALIHLATIAPLLLVVYSGGKSLHGWFPCLGQPEEKLRCFMALAVRLGADPAHWNRAQFTRVPDGTRADTGARQRIEFFNEKVLGL